MATLETTTKENLLLLSVTGEVSAPEMILVVKEYYPSDIYTNVIWDFTNGAMKADPAEYKAIAETVKTALEGKARFGGITVFIASTADDYKRLCLYAIMAESAKIPVKYYVCRTMEEAQRIIT